eukprot:g38317.t1
MARVLCAVLESTLQERSIAVEMVEKRFTRILSGLEIFSYEERLDKLWLFSSEHRRFGGVIIETYKIMRDRDRVDRNKLFPVREGSMTWATNL